MTEPARSTRHAYRDHLVAMMAADPKVVCLDTDTGLFSGVDFGPATERYLNLGIAEHNLMGVAAGLAASGWVPYVNTMAAFAASRAAEAVKIDIAYNGLPVRIVATHAGLSAGHLGPTHQSLEDLALMRMLPNMTVLVPGDPDAVIALLDQAAPLPGPVYLRLGRKAGPALPAAAGSPTLGRLQQLREGRRVLAIATGTHPVLRTLAAAEALAAEGIDVAVWQAHTVKPFDVGTLLAQAEAAELVVTVEEHWRTGGLGSTVAELLSESLPRPVRRVGWPDAFVSTVGTPEELLDEAGICLTGIVRTIRTALSEATTNRGVRRDQLPRV
jgi:transketolase